MPSGDVPKKNVPAVRASNHFPAWIPQSLRLICGQGDRVLISPDKLRISADAIARRSPPSSAGARG